MAKNKYLAIYAESGDFVALTTTEIAAIFYGNECVYRDLSQGQSLQLQKFSGIICIATAWKLTIAAYLPSTYLPPFHRLADFIPIFCQNFVTRL